jgi:lipid-binding SYLF domain-containing protein
MISPPSEKKTSPRHNNGIVDKHYVVRMVSADVRTDASGSNYTTYIMSVEVMESPSGEATKEVKEVPGLLLKDIVEHRYSEFAKLHAALEANLVSMVSPFPSKQRFKAFWKDDHLQEEMLIHQRKTQLDAWLMELCEWLNRGDLRGILYESVLEFFTVSAALPCDRANPISFDEWRSQTAKHINMEPSSPPVTDSTTDELQNTESNEEEYIFDEEEETFDNGDDDDDDLGFVMGDLPDADDHAVGSEKHLSKPVTFTLGSSIRQAAYTVMHMCCPPSHTNLYDQKHDISIPLDLLRNAKGLCFLTVVKAGFVISGRVGTGLVIARRPDGSWSPPSAIGTVGVGWGALIGGDITDYLLVLNTDGAVRSFGGTGTSGTVNLGAELGVAMGPVGRSATGNVQASDEGVHPVYAYAHSKGLFVGMSFEGSVVTSRPDVNAKFYGRPLEPVHILFDSTVPQPRAAEPLYEALDLAMGVEMPLDGIQPSQLLTKKQLATAAGDVSRRVSESIRNKYREHQQLRSQILQNNTTPQTSSPVPRIPASELAEPKSS